MKKRTISNAFINFDDSSFVHWEYIGKQMRLYSLERRWKVHVRVKQDPCIDEFFETWDKPSQATAEHFIKNAIKSYNKQK